MCRASWAKHTKNPSEDSIRKFGNPRAGTVISLTAHGKFKEPEAVNLPIAENLKYWQDMRHMTTADLAEKANVPEATITKIRTKVTKNPNMETLQRLAKALEVSINDLTDTPTVDEKEIRDLLPKKLPADQTELVELICTTLRNQRMASNRTIDELRKDRNTWRKISLLLVGCVVPLLIVGVVLMMVLYWDLSHPGVGNILLPGQIVP